MLGRNGAPGVVAAVAVADFGIILAGHIPHWLPQKTTNPRKLFPQDQHVFGGD